MSKLNNYFVHPSNTLIQLTIVVNILTLVCAHRTWNNFILYNGLTNKRWQSCVIKIRYELAIFLFLFLFILFYYYYFFLQFQIRIYAESWSLQRIHRSYNENPTVSYLVSVIFILTKNKEKTSSNVPRSLGYNCILQYIFAYNNQFYHYNL